MHDKTENKGNRLLRHSLNFWAQQAGRKYETYDRWAKSKGINLKAGQQLTLREFLEIAHGDKESEMIAKIRSERELNEQELKEKAGTLVNSEELSEMWQREFINPLRQKLFSLAKRHECMNEVLKLLDEMKTERPTK